MGLKIFYIILIIGFVLGIASHIVAYFLDKKVKGNIRDRLKKDE